jgi:hypothetical protein
MWRRAVGADLFGSRICKVIDHDRLPGLRNPIGRIQLLSSARASLLEAVARLRSEGPEPAPL